jgi:cobalamin biosynthesis Mg chelatase CobN
MAEMRFRARPSILLAGLLLLALPALAAAQPHPIAKPKDVTPIAPTKAVTPPASPPASPPPSPPPSPPSTSTTSGGTSSGTTGSSTTGTGTTGTGTTGTGTTGTTGTGTTGTGTGTTGTVPETVIVATAEGGRDHSGIAVPAPPPPEPTPLGLVAAGDRVSSPGTSTPAWKIALLALLAAAEAFLIVRLARNRPRGDLSPAA